MASFSTTVIVSILFLCHLTQASGDLNKLDTQALTKRWRLKANILGRRGYAAVAYYLDVGMAYGRSSDHKFNTWDSTSNNIFNFETLNRGNLSYFVFRIESKDNNTALLIQKVQLKLLDEVYGQKLLKCNINEWVRSSGTQYIGCRWNEKNRAVKLTAFKKIHIRDEGEKKMTLEIVTGKYTKTYKDKVWLCVDIGLSRGVVYNVRLVNDMFLISVSDVYADIYDIVTRDLGKVLWFALHIHAEFGNMTWTVIRTTLKSQDERALKCSYHIDELTLRSIDYRRPVHKKGWVTAMCSFSEKKTTRLGKTTPTLIVLAGKPKIRKSTDIVAGREVILTCSSFGSNKKPLFVLRNFASKKDTYELSKTRTYNLHGLQTWKHKVKNVFDWHDNKREVTCTVHTRYAVIKKTAVLRLNVLYKPFSVKDSPVLVHLYSHFTLVCLYYANPTPKTFYWFISGTLFRETQHGKLVVKVTNLSDGGKSLYSCKARNDVGMSDYLQIEVIYDAKRTTIEPLNGISNHDQLLYPGEILKLQCKTRFVQPNTIILWYFEDLLMFCQDNCTSEMSIVNRKHPNKDGELTSVLSLKLWRRYNRMRIKCLATTKDVMDSDETGSKLLAQESDVGVYKLRISTCEQGWYSIGVMCYKIFGFRNGVIKYPVINNIIDTCKTHNAKLGRLRSNREYMFVSKNLHSGASIAIIELKKGSKNKLKCHASRLDEKIMEDSDCFEVRCMLQDLKYVQCTMENIKWLCEKNRDVKLPASSKYYDGCPQRWITNANMCYKLASVRKLHDIYKNVQDYCYHYWDAKPGEIRNEEMLLSDWNVYPDEGVLALVSDAKENDKDCIVLGKSFARRYRDIYGRERYTAWTPVPCSQLLFSRWLCERIEGRCSSHDISCYEHFTSDDNEKLTFQEASDRCKRKNATLGIVRSLLTEFNLVDSQTMDVGLHDAIMIQGSDARQEGYWVYDDGTTMKYTHWADDPTDGADKDCVVLLRKSSLFRRTRTGGKDWVWWEDTSCTDKLFSYWLCEKEPGKITQTCPYRWRAYRDKCYGLFSHEKRKLNHYDAATDCAKDRGQLGRVESANAEYLFARVLDVNYYPGGILIQGSDKKEEGVWRYDDGAPMTYTNWGEPDNNADCVVLRKLSERRSDDKYGVENYTVWTDVPCTKQFSRWVCEKVVDDIEVCPQTWIRTDNSCYRIFTKPSNSGLNYENADLECQSIGARLGQIRSLSAEYDLVDSLKLTSGLDDAIMIQGTDGDREGYWTYDDRTPMKYTHWDNGDPLDADRRDCIVYVKKPMVNKRDNWISWTDVSCNDNIFSDWICEKKQQGGACTEIWWALHGNMCYRTFSSRTETLTHGQAHAKCEKENATLARIRARDVEVMSSSVHFSGMGFVNGMMIQGNDRELENRWVYDDGTPMTYTNWGFLSSKQKPCALVKIQKTVQNSTVKTADKLSWTNVPCSEASVRYYLCEKPGFNYDVGIKKVLPTGDIHEGSNVSLACSFGATEPDKIVWKALDISIYLFNRTSRISSTSINGKIWSHLSINRIAWWYNTVRIVCDYKGLKKTSVPAAVYRLKVKYKPRVTIVSHGQSTFQCVAMGNPPTTELHWQMNGSDSAACKEKTRCVIKKVGIYSCSAHTRLGMVGAFDTVIKLPGVTGKL